MGKIVILFSDVDGRTLCGLNCSSFIKHDQVVAGEVRWVITVPAIWRQQAKQFMREAAYQVQFVVKSLENKKMKTNE